ncbi:MAG: hypothetical protein ACTSYN_04525, partial [Candidatus Heimdallarchaeaceae archaeon]
AILIVDPSVISYDPDEFLDNYGPLLDTIALVAKGRTGFTYYQSNSAPQDKQYSVFFHSFCTIAENMGIRVHAYLSVHADNFLAQNNEFRVSKSDGSQIDLYACPSHQYIGKYHASIAHEIAQYPIESLIIDDLMYPSHITCFCDRCRRMFAVSKDIERDFTYEFLESRKLLNDWIDYRANFINQTLRDITETVKSLKNIEIPVVIKLDKETGYMNGAHHRFGENIVEITKITNNIIAHINPWSDISTDPTSSNYQELLSNLAPLTEYTSTGVKLSILFWGVSTEEKLNIALKLKDDLKADNLLVDISMPTDYTKRRTINLGF